MKKFLIKKVLIIGGTGFIGFHVAKYCKKKNFNVHIISRKKPKINRRLKNVRYFKADLSNKKELKKVIKKNTKYDYVINLGGEVQHNNKNKVKKSHFIGVKNLSEILHAQKKATENVFSKKNIPFRSFEIKKRDEKTLGELFTFFILETILIGKYLNINPYDQPAVELIKKETKKLLI